VLGRVAESAETTVLFESPERLQALLQELAALCGGERRVACARELTKLHETVVRGTLDEVVRYYQEHPPRGEVTLVVAPMDEAEAEPERVEADARSLARTLLAAGDSPSRAAREVARRMDLPRNRAYTLVQDEHATMRTTDEAT
jgi:16S rRNA (cytidine1402-2'-O)-methyltransferase